LIRIKPDAPIGTPEQRQLALDAAAEANRRQAAELALADQVVLAAERLLCARHAGGDLAGPYAALESALAAWSEGKISKPGYPRTDA